MGYRLRDCGQYPFRFFDHKEKQNVDEETLSKLTSQIHQELVESAAFRSFYRRADPVYLLRKS
jgi:hypothetical protein